MTGHADVRGAIEALRQGAVDYLLKPINPDELRIRLAQVVVRRRLEEARRESELFARSVLDSLSAHVAVLDHGGTILAVNQAWRDFAASNGASDGDIAEGANYLDICSQAVGMDAGAARAFASGIEDVVAGRSQSFEMEYPCHAPDRSRWFIGRVTPFQGGGPRRTVVAHVDITGRKLAEERAVQAERLAAIGEMVAGLAHESRNAFSVAKPAWRCSPWRCRIGRGPGTLIARLQKAQDDLGRLYEDVRDYAAPIQLRLSRVQPHRRLESRLGRPGASPGRSNGRASRGRSMAADAALSRSIRSG